LASTFCIPLSLNNEPEMSLMQLSQVIGTASNVWSQLVNAHVIWLMVALKMDTDLEGSCDGHCGTSEDVTQNM
jgi:hypothetical protein